MLYSLPASQRGVYSSVCVCCTASLPLKAVCVRVRERERFFACGIKRMCVCVFVHLGVAWALKQEQRGKVLSDVCNV